MRSKGPRETSHWTPSPGCSQLSARRDILLRSVADTPRNNAANPIEREIGQPVGRPALDDVAMHFHIPALSRRQEGGQGGHRRTRSTSTRQTRWPPVPASTLTGSGRSKLSDRLAAGRNDFDERDSMFRSCFGNPNRRGRKFRRTSGRRERLDSYSKRPRPAKLPWRFRSRPERAIGAEEPPRGQSPSDCGICRL